MLTAAFVTFCSKALTVQNDLLRGRKRIYKNRNKTGNYAYICDFDNS